MHHSKRIAVIGAGAAGLAVLKVFLEQPHVKDRDWTVTAFEARDDIGGVWLPAPPTTEPPLTPLYDSLTTNLPHPIMGYQSLLFPPSTPLFPRASHVLAYLRAYATTFGLMPHIKLNASVSNVEWTGSKWEVTVFPNHIHYYDVVIVANGHYALPRYPDQPGIDDWRRKGKVLHSAFYRNPQPFKGKTVLVIGGGPSGLDVSSEVATVAKKVYHSVTGSTPSEEGNVSKRGRPTEFSPDGIVRFADGTSASDIDLVLPATGYQYSLPFLPPSVLHTSPSDAHLWTSTSHLYPLAMHIFPLTPDFPPTSLAFIGLPSRVIPFPLFEAQTRVVYKVLSDPSSFSVPDQLAAVRARQEALLVRDGGNEAQVAKDWHRLPDQEQFDYRTELLAFAGVKEWAVEDWAREEYDGRGDVRRAWREIEARGEGEEWVRGVGEGGIEEWVDLMRRVGEWGRKHPQKEEVTVERV